MLGELMDNVDARKWDALAPFLHPDFRCTYVHTGEVLDREAWVRLNAEYPGFDRLRVEEITGNEDSAACRAHVTGFDAEQELNHFECATFVTVQDGLIHTMTEVWTDVDQTAPADTRPERAVPVQG